MVCLLYDHGGLLRQVLRILESKGLGMRRRMVFFGLMLVFSKQALADDVSKMSDAEKLFEHYQTLERNFDSEVADLYCDGALIQNTRSYSDGRERVLNISTEAYQALIRSTMPLAKAKGDSSTYSKVSYVFEGENIRVSAVRYSILKKYYSPLSLLIGECRSGHTGLLEELSYSQP